MRSILRGIKGIWADQRGATAVEYGMLVAAISAFSLITVFTVGDVLVDLFYRLMEIMFG